MLSAQLKSPSLFVSGEKEREGQSAHALLPVNLSTRSKGERGLFDRASLSLADMMGWDPLKRTNAPGVVV